MDIAKRTIVVSEAVGLVPSPLLLHDAIVTAIPKHAMLMDVARTANTTLWERDANNVPLVFTVTPLEVHPVTVSHVLVL